RKPSEVFSDEQRDLYKAFAPKGIKFDNLKILGPITTFKLKFQPEGFPQRVVAELWMYPDLSQVVELSIKTAPHQAFQVAAEARRMLTQRNIHPQGEQSMKTKAAMQFF